MVDELPLDEGPAPLSGNKAIEDAAIKFVMALENAKQRSYYEVPVPVAECDGAPGREALTG